MIISFLFHFDAIYFLLSYFQLYFFDFRALIAFHTLSRFLFAFHADDISFLIIYVRQLTLMPPFLSFDAVFDAFQQ